MSSNPFLGMFSKCICHSHCLSHCFFVGQVMFSHHSDQMSQRSQVYGMCLTLPGQLKSIMYKYSLGVFPTKIWRQTSHVNVKAKIFCILLNTMYNLLILVIFSDRSKMTTVLTLPSHMTGFLHQLGTGQSGIYRCVSINLLKHL